MAHLTSQPLVDAFARVPRERFLGPGPWQIARLDPESPYRTSDDADPRHIYHDVPVGLDPARLLNNGVPSALARWIEAVAIAPGESVLHMGCGTGYYTAIMAELAGSSGRVTAIEIDPALAARAREQLAAWPQVTVETGDGLVARGRFDVVFVNCGVTHVPEAWPAAVAPGGRLIVPLTVRAPQYPTTGIGVMVLAERRGEPWPARVVTPVGMYDCANGRDAEREDELRAALRSGALAKLSAVATQPHERGPACLVHAPGFCLHG